MERCTSPCLGLMDEVIRYEQTVQPPKRRVRVHRVHRVQTIGQVAARSDKRAPITLDHGRADISQLISPA